MKKILNRINGKYSRKKNNNSLKEGLIDAAIILLENHLPQDISAEMIINIAKVSRGSLYYHFNDLSELIEIALVRTFTKSVDLSIELMTRLLDEVSTPEELYEAIRDMTVVNQSADRRETRFNRIRLLGLASQNPRFAAKLAIEQRRLTSSHAALFEVAQERGWMTDDFDPRSAAVLIQAYTLGKVVDDIVPDEMDPDEWTALIMKIISRVFGVKGGAA